MRRFDTVGPSPTVYAKGDTVPERKLANQVPRHKSKKGGMQKRVYAWGGISWHGKTTLHTWTAKKATACMQRHTKNLVVGTVFLDSEEPTVWRVRCVCMFACVITHNIFHIPSPPPPPLPLTQVIETKSRDRFGGRIVDVITYCKHFEHLHADPPLDSEECEVSLYDEVREWHENSKVELSLREDLRPPNG